MSALIVLFMAFAMVSISEAGPGPGNPFSNDKTPAVSTDNDIHPMCALNGYCPDMKKNLEQKGRDRDKPPLTTPEPFGGFFGW